MVYQMKPPGIELKTLYSVSENALSRGFPYIFALKEGGGGGGLGTLGHPVKEPSLTVRDVF